MPSTAYGEYQQNLTDVHRLVRLHRQESGAGRGRRGLGHLTRGGLLLLCAAWERYVETVTIEAAAFLCRRLPGHASLPPTPRQRVTNHANDGRNAWTAAQLSTPTWANIYVDAITKRTDALNTPKHQNLKPLFEQFLAVQDIAACWTGGATANDDFVTLRGEAAHRGAQSQYIHFGKLVDLEASVSLRVVETDNFLSDHLRLLVHPRRRPWNRAL